MKFKKFDQINVLPFIDIMLVLLVVVLVSASFVNKGRIPVDLPEAEGKEVLVQQKFEVILIKRDGTLYFNDKKIDFNRLKDQISRLNPKKDAILIKSDAKSEFRNFVKVIDLLKSRGFVKVSIETKKV